MTARSTLRRAGGRLRRMVRAQGAPAAPEPRPERIPGVVELFTRRTVIGWVSVDPAAPPTRIDLYVGPVRLASTYATPDVPVVGVSHQPDREVGIELPTIPRMMPSPKDHRRNSARQVRTFSFRIHDLWAYAARHTRITVRAGGDPLPIVSHGMYLNPPRSGAHTPADLQARLDEGYVLSQHGDIQLSKRLDRQWQADVLDLYARVRALLADRFGYDLFVVYGTLLGAIRDGGFIGHDVDFDASYISRETTGAAAAAELVEIGVALIEAGYEVECMVACLHIADRGNPDNRIDIFHTFHDENGRWRFPFGIAGTTTLTAADWRGTEEIDFAGGRVLVPVTAEETVRHLYGDDWRLPKPGFNWALDRTDAATDGAFTPEHRTKVYWANFYARTEYTQGSTFFEFVQRYPGLPDTVIDIGCGDGRDACAFGSAGRRVLGLDQSPVGIEHATKKAAALGLADTTFRTCDVSDRAELAAALATLADRDEPTAFYLRFFLHAINEETQRTLLDAIDACSRPGDLFAAEFRTALDADQRHVHGGHYRRFQDAGEFLADLRRRGWTVLHDEEGTGLSPYKGEDPVLARVIARR
ncbi:methyltransferase domain-containing protein [Nocardioides sp. SYSU DS0651]|uniref:class I SAM-dependent methyltransferase n=1 Tax=Nocardioides sp. SYSU DS0651 TaxID=3415955 RepID=UPI003F4C36C5